MTMEQDLIPQTHMITHFSNGTPGGYLEMTCWNCQRTFDLFDFQRNDWLDAAENDFDMRCPGCEHAGAVDLAREATHED